MMRQTANAVKDLDREHEEMDKLSARIESLAPGRDRTALVHELCARFVIHAQVEERYLHPVMRCLLRDGGPMTAEQVRRDHAVARIIECVERKNAQDEEFDSLVSRLVVGVQDHLEQQDIVLLPALTGMGSAEEIKQLSRQLRDGFPAARQAAERAGARACEQADGEPDCDGFRALLQRIARGPAADVLG